MRAKNLPKILGLSLLVAVGVMAVSASAAQAKWLLLRNGVSVLEIKLKGEVLLFEVLVLGGLELHCTKGTGSATLRLSSDHKALSKEGFVTWNECKPLGAPNCTVKSPGAKAGEIIAKGSGTVEMSGEEVYGTLKSNEFSEILIEGPLCAANETDELLNGTLRFDIDEPLKDQKIHLVKILDKGMFFGEEKAVVHGELLAPNVHDPWVLAHLEEETGATWAIHLVEL